MPKGMCKLCLKQRDLQESHLMPRALYRMARGVGTKGNQDPHVLTAKGGKPSSHQVKDYLLCWDCEQRFSQNGEHYVMNLLTRRNRSFPLLDVLNSVPPTMVGPKWKVYSSSDTPMIDRAKIAYFAISVFWRASVHTWEQENGGQIRIRLGEKYNEEFRKYLLGETLVPKNASLQLIVCSDVTNQNTFFAPQENQKVKDRSVIFLARGVLFFLRVSNTLQGFQQRLSLINSEQEWITIRNCTDRPVWAVG